MTIIAEIAITFDDLKVLADEKVISPFREILEECQETEDDNLGNIIVYFDDEGTICVTLKTRVKIVKRYRRLFMKKLREIR